MKDQCYYQVKSRVNVFPSARASQMIAKCRKKHHQVRKTKEGAALKRWTKEKWVNTKTGKPCGAGKNDSRAYCRPSKHISKQTPIMSKSKNKAMQRRKAKGLRALPRFH